MSLNESIFEDATLEWFLLRQGFHLRKVYGGRDGGRDGGKVGELVPRPGEIWGWAAFGELRRPEPHQRRWSCISSRVGDSVGKVVLARDWHEAPQPGDERS